MEPPRLPLHLLEEIFNRLGDARYIASAQLLCKDWRDAGNNVRSLLCIVLDVYHESARNNTMAVTSGSMSDGGESASSSQDTHGGKLQTLPFKEQMVKIVEKKHYIEQVRIEVECKLQAKAVPEEERRRTDFWLSDPWFLRQWLPRMGSILQHLCIVDYAQQAIMRRSTILKILSENCKRLKTLDLRNMFIDTSGCEEMNLMASLTLRCVKVVGEALQHINDKMPKLQTLALLGVFGVERADLTFQDMKVLCLGLSTPAKNITMVLPKLEKLQLKMQCPQKLSINAAPLKYVAFNLDVLEPSKVELRCMVGLQELLYGASSFITLSSLIDKNPALNKLFLDIPCMALGEDGRFLGVLRDIPLSLPSFPCAHQTLDLPCMALLRDGSYLDILNDLPVNLLCFSRFHECGDPAVSNTPSGRLRNQWKWETPNGLNLVMKESRA